MSPRRQWLMIGLVLLTLGVLLRAGQRGMAAARPAAGVGSRAPDFSATTLDGSFTVKTLDDYRGKVLLLNLWATWCVPCRTEMPSIQALHDRFAPYGLKAVAVSVDRAGLEEEIAAFGREYHLTFELLHEPTGAIQDAYRTNGVPETFVIDGKGVIRKRVIGASNWDSPANRALIASLLGVSLDGPIAGDSANPIVGSGGPR